MSASMHQMFKKQTGGYPPVEDVGPCLTELPASGNSASGQFRRITGLHWSLKMGTDRPRTVSDNRLLKYSCGDLIFTTLVFDVIYRYAA